MGRRREATLQDIDVNFNSLIRGQIRREVRSELQAGFREVFVRFAQLFREPRTKRGVVSPPEETAEKTQALTKITQRKRRAGVDPLVVQLRAAVSKVFRNQCSQCDSKDGPFHTVFVKPSRHAMNPHRIAATFFRLLRRGKRAVRKHFHHLCHRCMTNRSHASTTERLSALRQRVTGALGTVCDTCKKKPRKLHIFSPRHGPRTDETSMPLLRRLSRELDKNGAAWLQKTYKLQCRGCVTKERIDKERAHA